MPLQDNKNLPVQPGEAENKIERAPVREQQVHFGEAEKTPEKKEKSEDEKIISDELKREIELMDIDGNLKKQAEQKANKIQFLADDDKLKTLMNIAKEKGVLVAVKTAMAMNDPFVLDNLHDALAKEGYYKKFIKK